MAFNLQRKEVLLRASKTVLSYGTYVRLARVHVAAHLLLSQCPCTSDCRVVSQYPLSLADGLAHRGCCPSSRRPPIAQKSVLGSRDRRPTVAHHSRSPRACGDVVQNQFLIKKVNQSYSYLLTWFYTEEVRFHSHSRTSRDSPSQAEWSPLANIPIHQIEHHQATIYQYCCLFCRHS